jgi:hypothetical protein
MRDLAAEALRDFEARPCVVGVARGRDDRLTFLLDRDDAATRSAVRCWARSHATEVVIRVVGEIVTT